MVIALLEVSLCLLSVVCGLIGYIVIVICGGVTLSIFFPRSRRGVLYRGIQIISVTIRARTKVLLVMFFYIVSVSSFISLSFYIISLSLPLAIGY